MTDRQQKFCDEYLIDCNATRAYRAAYPHIKSDNVASASGSRLLNNARIKAYIDERLAELSTEKLATAQEVIEYLTRVMRGESTSQIVVVEGREAGGSEARRMEKAPDEKERLRAAELLGRRYGLFTDKVTVDGSVSTKVDRLSDILRQLE